MYFDGVLFYIRIYILQSSDRHRPNIANNHVDAGKDCGLPTECQQMVSWITLSAACGYRADRLNVIRMLVTRTTTETDRSTDIVSTAGRDTVSSGDVQLPHLSTNIQVEERPLVDRRNTLCVCVV